MPDTAAITISPMASAADADAFRTLNEEWISALFTLEPADHDILDAPQTRIVDQGGQVLVVRNGTDADSPVVGCVALVRGDAGSFELSKMAVSPTLRGRGIGRALILAAIEHARTLGATRLFLGSNSRLVNAVHLYESVGFRHVPDEDRTPMPYTRADVFMELSLV